MRKDGALHDGQQPDAVFHNGVAGAGTGQLCQQDTGQCQAGADEHVNGDEVQQRCADSGQQEQGRHAEIGVRRYPHAYGFGMGRFSVGDIAMHRLKAGTD